MMHGGQLDEDCLDSAHGLLQGMVQDSGMMPWLDHLQLSAESLISDELGPADQEGALHLGDVGVGVASSSPHLRKRTFDAGPGSESPAHSQPLRQRARHGEYSAASGGAAQPGTTSDAEAVEGMVQLLAGNNRAPAAAPRASAAESEPQARSSEPAARGGGGATRGGGLVVKTEEGTTPQVPWSPGAGEKEIPSEAPTPSSSGPRRDKGLRSFSLKVCQKVEERDVTTYNQVADELVFEFKQDSTIVFDEKNIRRRIYDALNVLMAMDIITRDKKNIRWKGFPQSREKERSEAERRIAEVSQGLSSKLELLEKRALQYIARCNLEKRNAAAGPAVEKEGARSGDEWGGGMAKRTSRIKIPFVVVQTAAKNNIDLEMSQDRSLSLLCCQDVFRVHDDVAVLDFMGMAQCDSEAELRQLLTRTPDVVNMLLKSNPGVVRRASGAPGGGA